MIYIYRTSVRGLQLIHETIEGSIDSDYRDIMEMLYRAIPSLFVVGRIFVVFNVENMEVYNYIVMENKDDNIILNTCEYGYSMVLSK